MVSCVSVYLAAMQVWAPNLLQMEAALLLVCIEQTRSTCKSDMSHEMLHDDGCGPNPSRQDQAIQAV